MKRREDQPGYFRRWSRPSRPFQRHGPKKMTEFVCVKMSPIRTIVGGIVQVSLGKENAARVLCPIVFQLQASIDCQLSIFVVEKVDYCLAYEYSRCFRAIGLLVWATAWCRVDMGVSGDARLKQFQYCGFPPPLPHASPCPLNGLVRPSILLLLLYCTCNIDGVPG